MISGCLPWLSCYSRLLQPGCFLSLSKEIFKDRISLQKGSFSQYHKSQQNQTASPLHSTHWAHPRAGYRVQKLRTVCCITVPSKSHSTTSSPLWPAGTLGAAPLVGQAPGSVGRPYSSVQLVIQATQGTGEVWKQRVMAPPLADVPPHRLNQAAAGMFKLHACCSRRQLCLVAISSVEPTQPMRESRGPNLSIVPALHFALCYTHPLFLYLLL